VQKQRREDPSDEDSDYVDMDDFMIRPKLSVSRETGEFTVNQGIRDLRKKIPRDQRRKGQLPYELATDDSGDPLTPDTVHEFIKFKTPCFGTHDLSQGCCSQKGISCPSSISLLMAKKPKGRKPTFDKHFNEDEMEAWGDVDAFEEDSEGSGDAEGAGESGDAGEYGDLMDAVDGAESDGIEDPASEEGGESSEEASESGEDVDEDDLDSASE